MDVAFDDNGVLCTVKYFRCKNCGNTVGILETDDSPDDLKNFVIKEKPPVCDVCGKNEWEFVEEDEDD